MFDPCFGFIIFMGLAGISAAIVQAGSMIADAIKEKK